MMFSISKCQNVTSIYTINDWCPYPFWVFWAPWNRVKPRVGQILNILKFGLHHWIALAECSLNTFKYIKLSEDTKLYIYITSFCLKWQHQDNVIKYRNNLYLLNNEMYWKSQYFPFKYHVLSNTQFHKALYVLGPLLSWPSCNNTVLYHKFD